MVARTCGIITATPTPWSRRAPISTPGPVASPHSSEAAVNTTVPISRILRRP
ncbi:hypothetical protein SALBM135S_06190 [Streptomyces alboniger]